MSIQTMKAVALAAALTAIGSGELSASTLGDSLVQMDPAAPKYASAGCTAARARALAYDQDGGARLTISVLLSPAFLGAIYLDAQDKKAHDIAQDLVTGCGRETFIPYFRARAQGGDADAQAWMGQAYEMGANGNPDWAQAVVWYRKAADQGDVAAEVNLGAIYCSGKGGVPKNVPESIALWNAAAKKNSPEAETNLASLYIDGADVAQDFAKAVGLLRRASGQGHASAQFMLAALFEKGNGVSQNSALAYALYDLAAENGHASAAAKRDELAATLNERQLTAGKSTARRCRRSNYVDCPI